MVRRDEDGSAGNGHATATAPVTRSTNGTGNLDAGSGFTPDGTITLVISDSKLAPAQGGPLAAGKSLTGFLSRIRLETQTGSALTPDNAPDSVAGTGEYVLSGNAWCSNAAPSASLAATPTSGLAPLTVRFDGVRHGSRTPATRSRRTRSDFGDGTPPVTQSSPTVSHTYSDAGDVPRDGDRHRLSRRREHERRGA